MLIKFNKAAHKDIKMLQKKFLPYSKPLVELQKKGYAPSNDVYVFIGNHAWKKSEKFSISHTDRLLCLPPWQNPFDFYWPVRECDVLVFDTGYAENDYLEDIAVCLYKSHASMVRMISPHFELTLYDKE